MKEIERERERHLLADFDFVFSTIFFVNNSPTPPSNRLLYFKMISTKEKN